MKLTEIAIDGYRGTRDTRLQKLSQGLNLVFSSHPTTGNAISNFVLDVLYGPDRQSFSSAVEWPNGYLNVQSGNTEYQLARPHSAQNGELTVSDLAGNRTTHRTPDLLSQLDPKVYAAFFNVRLGGEMHRHDDWARELVKQFDLSAHQATGAMPFINDQASFQSWKSAAVDRQSRLQTLRQEIETLNQERIRIVSERERYQRDHQQRLVEVESELSVLQTRYDSLSAQFNRERSELSEIDRQIAELVHFIEREENNVSHVPISRPQTNYVAIYYERLDEIDNQIRRWRSVQSDIQDQRMRLRDELVSHEDLNLSSQDHPYHDAREILLALESRVDRTEEIAQAIDHAVTPQENSRRLTHLCSEMRDDLQALCGELGRQYKHVRHKAVVAELKQLRRCFHEMDENVKRLLLRRESVLGEISQLDPSGADAILHANQAFLVCAEKEGYLVARQQFVSGKPVELTSNSVEYRTVYPDMTTEQTRLTDLQTRRSVLSEQIARFESELSAIDPRRTSLIDERNRLSGHSIHEMEHRLQTIDGNLSRLRAEESTLTRQIATDQQWLDWKPNYLLTEASRYLRSLTNDRWSDVKVDHNGQITVHATTRAYDHHSHVTSAGFAAPQPNNGETFGHSDTTQFTSLSKDEQSVVRLSLSLAAVGQLALRGIRLPMLVEDETSHLTNSLLTTLTTFSENGHQLVLLTANRQLLDTAQRGRVTVFEMPDTQITPATWRPETPSIPRREVPPAPNYPTSHQQPMRPHYETPQLYSYPQPVHSRPVETQATRKVRETARDMAQPIEQPFKPVTSSAVPWTTTTPLASLQPTFVPTPVVASPRSVGTRETMLQDIDLVESIYLTPMESIGVLTMGQLLDLDVDDQETELTRRGFNVQQIRRWQSQAWLLISLSDMTAADARVLVGSGIQSPDLILQMSEADISERVSRYLESSAGRRSNASLNQFGRGRIRGWAERLRRDSSWQNLRPRRSNSRSRTASRDRQPPIRSERSERELRSARAPQPRTVQPRPATTRTVGRQASIASTRPTTPTRAAASSSSSSSQDRYKFYLNMTDDIEAAPSIGPKTAEKFYATGVNTVAEFLAADAIDMASQIENRRMSAKVITLWQNQARLMCAVPNLRGHDVQFLIGSGFLEPHQISSTAPDELLERITRFLKTKEGTRALRNGKEPDLEEISDWIDAANHVRSLKAA